MMQVRGHRHCVGIALRGAHPVNRTALALPVSKAFRHSNDSHRPPVIAAAAADAMYANISAPDMVSVPAPSDLSGMRGAIQRWKAWWWLVSPTEKSEGSDNSPSRTPLLPLLHKIIKLVAPERLMLTAATTFMVWQGCSLSLDVLAECRVCKACSGCGKHLHLLCHITKFSVCV
jgi:hypothetical protein